MLVIFSKLEIGADDWAWIDAIRMRHDPQRVLVEPHVTFVFPFDGLSIEDVLAHIQAVADDTPPVAFGLSQAIAARNQFGSGSHLFLLPTEGEATMRGLHARLYSGVLASKLHPTAIYAPHVTVGAFEHHEDAERVASALPAFDIWGVLRALQIADFDGKRLTPIQALPLGPPR